MAVEHKLQRFTGNMRLTLLALILTSLLGCTGKPHRDARTAAAVLWTATAVAELAVTIAEAGATAETEYYYED